MSSQARWLIIIVLLTAFSLWIALPPETKGVTPDAPICGEMAENPTVDTQGIKCTEDLSLDLNADGVPEFNLSIQQSLGLDLVGGLRVLLEAASPSGTFTSEELRETANNVSRRVNSLGLTEATVQMQGANRILVELPGVRDPQQAIDTIRQTALLEFVDFGGMGARVREFVGSKILTTEQVRLQESSPSAEATPEPELGDNPAVDDEPQPIEEPRLLSPLTGQPFETVLTGAGLQAAAAQLSPGSQTGGGSAWIIQFELKPEAGERFGSFTGSRLGEPMALVLDGEVLSAPVIQAQLDTGGIITGDFTEDEARQLALQLRSGALPIPLRVESAVEVGATLGQESVRLSIRAGVIGIAVVLSFMLIYYRMPGVAADIALLVFVVLNLAIYKLLPVTLTLPAITGFLIGIGTAVDGNILIFERIKEELRGGKPLDEALESGFDRAWNSIRDSNLSTIVISFILFMFGQTPGASIVSGFALTLIISLLLNLFTAIIVTRTVLALLVAILRGSLASRQWLLGV